jgi:hypothetical protein
MRLVQSHLADVIVSMEMGTAVRHLYNKRDNGENKGRVLALFRHPIDRLVSKFYYLQVATWEKSYRPEWNDLSLLEWAKNNKRGGADSNIMVQKLTGKAWSDRVGEKDLRVAKKILRDHVVVGLLDDAEESFRRFNIVLGIDERLERNERCMNELFSSKENSNNHPKVSSWALCNTFRLFLPSCTFCCNSIFKIVEGSTEWNVLARKNTLDIRLYRYIQRLYLEQRTIIDSYVT